MTTILQKNKLLNRRKHCKAGIGNLNLMLYLLIILIYLHREVLNI